MYESPIEIITRQIANDFDLKIGEEVFRSILKVGVKVDEKELIKALQYDRDQYNKGFNDGVKEFAERLKKEAEIVSGGDYGFTFEIREDDIDNLVKEMEGGSE